MDGPRLPMICRTTCRPTSRGCRRRRRAERLARGAGRDDPYVKSILPFVDPAAEKVPMTRVPYVRQIIAQLHDVATVFEHEQRCHGVAGHEWSSRSQKVFD